MKKLLEWWLKVVAKIILWQYHPIVVAITGSVGKTSAKEAVFAVLSQFLATRTNLKNYNNEVGLPLSIIGSESGRKNIFRWLGVMTKAKWLALGLSKKYPKVLVLEMGADHPGDLKYLTSIAKPQLAIVTAVAPAHLEWFKNLVGVKKEKQTIVQVLPANGLAVLNGDDSLVRAMSEVTKARFVTYGFKDNNTFQAKDWQLAERNGQIGMAFKLNYQGNVLPIFLPNILGWQQILAVLPAVAAGVSYFKIPILDVVKALGAYQPPRGRTNLIKGQNQSWIIDDSYNSSPEATKAALDLLVEFQAKFGGRKIVVLGDMLELGDFAEAGHREVGRQIAKLGIDCLVTVGRLAEYISQEAQATGLPTENIHHFTDNNQAIEFLVSFVKPQDALLIKGSQGARMERVAKALMAEPARAKDLLVRQDSYWVRRP